MSKTWNVIGATLSGLLVAGSLTGLGVFAVTAVNTNAHHQQVVNASIAQSRQNLLDAQNAAAVDARISSTIGAQELATQQAIAAAASKAAAEAAAKAAAEAAAAAAAQKVAAPTVKTNTVAPTTAPSSGLPKGSPVPWIASTDPQNSAGGMWNTMACASHSASGNPATCD